VRIVVGIPSFEMVHADFAMSLAVLARRTAEHELFFVNAKNSLVAEARNRIVAAARELQAGAILFLDSDLVFPPDTLARLLAHDLPVVCATYARRTPPHDAVGAMLEGDFSSQPGTLARMKRVPTGCLLLALPVLAQLPDPVFRTGIDPETAAIVGEDYVLSDALRACGTELWCDLALSRELRHLGQVAWRLD
jgi:glycosyltransferase involved in cell wall biosynthesis